MKPQVLESYSTQKLKSKENFFTFSLTIVCLGAFIAITATFYNYFNSGEFSYITFITALLAVAVSVPVYLNRMQIRKVLKNR